MLVHRQGVEPYSYFLIREAPTTSWLTVLDCRRTATTCSCRRTATKWSLQPVPPRLNLITRQVARSASRGMVSMVGLEPTSRSTVPSRLRVYPISPHRHGERGTSFATRPSLPAQDDPLSELAPTLRLVPGARLRAARLSCSQNCQRSSTELHSSRPFVLRSVSYGSPVPRVSQRTIAQRVTRRSTKAYLELSGGNRTPASGWYPLSDSNRH